MRSCQPLPLSLSPCHTVTQRCRPKYKGHMKIWQKLLLMTPPTHSLSLVPQSPIAECISLKYNYQYWRYNLKWPEWPVLCGRCLPCSVISTLAYLSDVSFCYGNGRFKQLMGNLHKDFINIAENTKYFDRTGRWKYSYVFLHLNAQQFI